MTIGSHRGAFAPKNTGSVQSWVKQFYNFRAFNTRKALTDPLKTITGKLQRKLPRRDKSGKLQWIHLNFIFIGVGEPKMQIINLTSSQKI